MNSNNTIDAGRLSRAKGVLMLVASWRELLARHPEALLVMAGSGEGSWDDCEEQLKGLVRDQALAGDVLLIDSSTDATPPRALAAGARVLRNFLAL